MLGSVAVRAGPFGQLWIDLARMTNWRLFTLPLAGRTAIESTGQAKGQQGREARLASCWIARLCIEEMIAVTCASPQPLLADAGAGVDGVFKFGGTSLGSRDNLVNVIDIIKYAPCLQQLCMLATSTGLTHAACLRRIVEIRAAGAGASLLSSRL